jgi:competence protein ComFC
VKCLLCQNYSLTQHICQGCQEKFLKPSLYKRKLSNGTTVISFYKYKEIKELLFTKHTDIGFHIYRLLAKCSFAPFCQTFTWQKRVASIAIDDLPKYGYAHTAILNKALTSSSIKPYTNKLRAQNPISYSGKSKAFREANPRDFSLKSFQEDEVIIVDDIITTGTTLREASDILTQNSKEVLFCLTLADAGLK